MRMPYASTVRSILLAASAAIFITSVGFASTMSSGASPRHTADVIQYQAQPVAQPTPERAFTQQRVLRSKQVTPALTYTVRTGDTLASIAKKVYGDVNAWPALWWLNKAEIPNPNSLKVGTKLRIGRTHPVPDWMRKAALKAIPAPVSAARTTASVSYSTATVSGPWPGGAFGACVVQRESGGNPQVMNSSGHYGLYQFSASTWQAYGGSPADFGHASVAEQERVFMNALAQGGQSNWSPYDGC